MGTLQTTSASDGWSLVTEPGWFHAEVPGKVVEGSVVHEVGGGSITLKQVVAKSSSRYVAFEYADVPAGFSTTPRRLVAEMQKAMLGADASVVQTQQRDVAGYASVESVADVPAHTRTNPSVFEMTAHTEVFASPRRLMVVIDIRQKGDPDDRVVRSFVAM